MALLSSLLRHTVSHSDIESYYIQAVSISPNLTYQELSWRTSLFTSLSSDRRWLKALIGHKKIIALTALVSLPSVSAQAETRLTILEI